MKVPSKKKAAKIKGAKFSDLYKNQISVQRMYLFLII